MKTRSSNKNTPKEKDVLPKKLSDRKLEKLSEAKRASQEYILAKSASQDLVKKTLGESFLTYLQNVEKKFPGILIFLSEMNDPVNDETPSDEKKSLYSAPQGRLFNALNVNKKTSARKTSQNKSSEKSEASTSGSGRKIKISDKEINEAIAAQPALTQELEAYMLKTPTHYTIEVLNKLLSYRRSFVNGIMPENWLSKISDRLNTEHLSKAERDPTSEEPPTPEQIAAQRLRDNKLANYICGAILFKLQGPILSELIYVPLKHFVTRIWNNPDNNVNTIILNQLEALARQVENNFKYGDLITYINARNNDDLASSIEHLKASLITFNPLTHRDLIALQEQGMNVFLSHWFNIMTNQTLRAHKSTHKELKKMIVSYLKLHMETIIKFRNSILLTLQILEACENGEKPGLLTPYKLFKRKIQKHYTQQVAKANAERRAIPLPEHQADEPYMPGLEQLQNIAASLPDDLALSLTPEHETLTTSTLSPSSSTYSRILVERTLSLNDLSATRGSTGSESETSSANRSGSSSHNPHSLARRLTQLSLKRGAKAERMPSQETLDNYEIAARARKQIKITSESRETSPPVPRRNPRPVRKTNMPDELPVTNSSRETVQIPATLFTPAPAPAAQPAPERETTPPMLYSKKRK